MKCKTKYGIISNINYTFKKIIQYMLSCIITEKILIFSDGKIVECINHKELINKGYSLYSELFNAQTNFCL